MTYSNTPTQSNMGDDSYTLEQKKANIMNKLATIPKTSIIYNFNLQQNQSFLL